MTTEDRDRLKIRLDKKIRITKEKILQMEDMTAPVTPENSIGRISRMDAINNKSVMEAALRTSRSDLEDMEYALNHLGDKDFGQCAKCKNEININRLMLIPGSKYCINCAT